MKAHKKSFNDYMMKVAILPLIFAFIGLALLAGYFSIVEGREINDKQINTIMILGSPALLAITGLLKLWEKEQGVEIDLHPTVTESASNLNDAEAEHRRLLSKMELEHQQTLALKQQEHEHCLAHEKQKAELGVVNHHDEE